MKRFALLMLALALALLPMFAAATEPLDDVGVHYKSGPVAYENDRLIVMREGLTLNHDGSGYAERIYYKFDLAEGPPSDVVQAQVVADTLTNPSYDSHERTAFKVFVVTQVGDVVTTAFGLTHGCSELNPLFRAHPELAVLAKAGLLMYVHHDLVSSPRFHSGARALSAPIALGGYTTLHNLLLSCG